jgi:hypothetical protein
MKFRTAAFPESLTYIGKCGEYSSISTTMDDSGHLYFFTKALQLALETPSRSNTASSQHWGV